MFFLNQKEIIQQCKENKYSAQLEVYNSYKNMLYSSCVRILKSREDAEDIVHDAFIKGFQKIHQVSDEVNLGAWFRRIAVNIALDKIRKEKKTVWVEETKELEAQVDEVEVGFDNAEDFSIETIKECIHSLKDKYRVILILYLIEDYNHREISEQLELNESTVRNQYARGKSKLVALLQKQQQDEFKRAHTTT